MAKKELATIGSKSFEDLKKINEHGAEYWLERKGCSYHFAEAGKLIGNLTHCQIYMGFPF